MSQLPAAVLLTLFALTTAQAQTFPVRPLKIVVPSAAGGGTDVTTRLLAPRLTEALGQQVIVDNRGGAASLIGTDVVAKSAPDGYTVVMGISTLAINPWMLKKMPYDTQRDLAPISQVVVLPNMLIGHPSLPAKNLKEFVAFIKSRPDQIQFGSAGRGSNLHLSMELFLLAARLKMVHVPYRGSGQGIVDVVSGMVPTMVTNMLTALPMVKSGKVRGYGVTSARRSAAMPDMPTIAEQGYPDYEAVQWYGLLAPGATPRPVITRWHDATVKALQDAETRKRFIDSGADPVGNTPEEFAAVIRKDLAKWERVIKAAGIPPE